MLVCSSLLAIGLTPIAGFGGPRDQAPREVVLRDDSFVQSADGRDLLAYLISCALPADVRVIANHGDHRYEFSGDMSIAPEWVDAPLRLWQQRRLSACILARTNRLGRQVQISMRSSSPDAPERLSAGKVGAVERAQFAFFEGAFFGNLFDEPARAYVCIGEMHFRRRAWLESQMRECTLSDETGPERGAPSRCRMVIVGPCSPANYIQDGVDYSSDAIEVYLPGVPD